VAAGIFQGIETTCQRIDEFFVDIAALRQEAGLSDLADMPSRSKAGRQRPSRPQTPPPELPVEQPAAKRPGLRRNSLFSKTTRH